MRFANEIVISMLDQLAGIFSDGSEAAVIEIRTGSSPSTVEAASTGTLLAVLTCSTPAFGSAADQNPGARIAANSITSEVSAIGTGTAGYFVAGTSDAADTITTKVIVGTVGTSGTDMTLDSVNIVAGGPVNMVSWVIDLAEA